MKKKREIKTNKSRMGRFYSLITERTGPPYLTEVFFVKYPLKAGIFKSCKCKRFARCKAEYFPSPFRVEEGIASPIVTLTIELENSCRKWYKDLSNEQRTNLILSIINNTGFHLSEVHGSVSCDALIINEFLIPPETSDKEIEIH